MIETLLLMILQGVVTALVILFFSMLSSSLSRRSFAKAWDSYLKERSQNATTSDKIKSSDFH